MLKPQRFFNIYQDTYLLLSNNSMPLFYNSKSDLIGFSPFVHVSQIDYLNNLYKTSLLLKDLQEIIQDIKESLSTTYNSIASHINKFANEDTNNIVLDEMSSYIQNFFPAVSLPLIQNMSFTEELKKKALSGSSIEDVLNDCIKYKYNSEPVYVIDEVFPNPKNKQIECKIEISMKSVFAKGMDKASIQKAKFNSILSSLKVLIGEKLTSDLMLLSTEYQINKIRANHK